METSQLLLTNAVMIGLMMFAVWLVSLPLRDASIVDMGWGGGFVVVAWVSFLRTDEADVRMCLLVACASLWGLRLSSYLIWRNFGKPEDYRYRAMREKYGKSFPLMSLVIVFALQGMVMWVVSLPLQTGQLMTPRDSLDWLTAVGLFIWLCGLGFEAIGDFQLARFKREPSNAGKVLNTGLWRYTRHPNYFGDFLVWWGLYLLAMGDGSFWWSIIGPFVMSIFLIRISGVALLEKSLANSKAGYADYVRMTSAFLPMPPRKQ